MAAPLFTWGEFEAAEFIEILESTYAEAIHWRFNLFKVPYGAAGKAFVSELARLFRAFGEASALESIAMKAATIMPILLLQKPSSNSKAKEHAVRLQHRLNTWKQGDLRELVREGRTIQQRLPRNKQSVTHEENLSRQFTNYMFQGNVKAALRLLSEESRGGILHLSDTTDTPSGPKIF